MNRIAGGAISVERGEGDGDVCDCPKERRIDVGPVLLRNHGQKHGKGNQTERWPMEMGRSDFSRLTDRFIQASMLPDLDIYVARFGKALQFLP